jgi:hypothetical protein
VKELASLVSNVFKKEDGKGSSLPTLFSIVINLGHISKWYNLKQAFLDDIVSFNPYPEIMMPPDTPDTKAAL